MKQIIPTFENYNLTNALFELSENSTLYHRSIKKLKVGDVIKPRKIKGSHWLEKSEMELALEQMRKESYPHRPSRFDCVYTSPHPRSRFLDKGDLYVVRPVGNMFMTDSTLIDDIGEQFSRWFYSYDGYGLSDYERPKIIKLANQGDERALKELVYGLPYEANLYWQGKGTQYIKDLEILSDSAVVTEVPVEEIKRLKINQNVKVVEEGLVAWLTIYFNTRDAKRTFTEEEAIELINQIKNEVYESDVKIEDKEYARKRKGEGKDGFDEMTFELKGTLRKGAKLKINYVRSGIAYSTTRRDFDEIPQRYTNISYDFYIKRKLYKRKDSAPYFRFESHDFLNRGVWDMSKFFDW